MAEAYAARNRSRQHGGAQRRARGGCWTFTRGCVPFNDAGVSRNVQYAKRTALTRSTLYTLDTHSED